MAREQQFQKKACPICEELGRTVGQFHPVEICWTNPKSKTFRPSTYLTIVNECLKNGKPIPKLMDLTSSEVLVENWVTLPPPPAQAKAPTPVTAVGPPVTKP